MGLQKTTTPRPRHMGAGGDLLPGGGKAIYQKLCLSGKSRGIELKYGNPICLLSQVGQDVVFDK